MAELLRYDYAVQDLLRYLWIYGHRGAESVAKPAPGDLVILQSAPQSEWHLSFYVEDCGDGYYHLLESLKTGTLCRWGNVGFLVISRKWVAEQERIHWNDEQFHFAKRFTAEIARGGYYINLPFMGEFNRETLVIRTRTRHSFDKVTTSSAPIPWATMTRAEIRCAIAVQVRQHKQARDAARETEPAHG